jgi:hypothetical protein
VIGIQPIPTQCDEGAKWVLFNDGVHLRGPLHREMDWDVHRLILEVSWGQPHLAVELVILEDPVIYIIFIPVEDHPRNH